MPLIIQQMEEAPPGDPAASGIVLPALRQSFGLLLSQCLERAQITLAADVRQSVDLALDQVIAAFSPPAPAPGSVLAVADALVAAVTTVLGPSASAPGLLDPAVLAALTAELKEAARWEFVQVLTAELRLAGPSDLLARLHLSVSENAVEWVVTESQGITRSRLVPE
jgi:hypothetical protein